MNFRTFKKVLLVGSVLGLGTFHEIQAATNMYGLASNTAETITTYAAFNAGTDMTGGHTATGISFSPLSSGGVSIAEFIGTHTIDLTTPQVNDGVTIRMAISNKTVLLTSPSFTMTSSRPYMSFDVANTGMHWAGTPTFSGSGWIEVNANTTWTFDAAMTFSAPIRIASGVTLTIQDNGANAAVSFTGLISGAGTLIHESSDGTHNITPTFTVAPTVSYYIENTAVGFLLGNGVNFGSAITLGHNTIMDAVSGGSATISGVISGAYSVTKSTYASSTLILSGANTYSGNTAVSAGTLSAGNNTAFGTGSITISNSSVLTVASSGLSLSNAITSTLANFNIPTNYTATLSGAITDAVGGGVLTSTKSGAGTLNLSSSSNAPTAWAFNGGRVNISAPSAVLGAPVTVQSPTTLGFLIGSPTLANAFAAAALLTVDAPVNVSASLTGILSGLSGIIKTGLGNVTIGTGVTNTYMGGTTVNAGTLTMGAASALGGSAACTVLPGAALITNGTAFNVNVTSATATLAY